MEREVECWVRFYGYLFGILSPANCPLFFFCFTFYSLWHSPPPSLSLIFSLLPFPKELLHSSYRSICSPSLSGWFESISNISGSFTLLTGRQRFEFIVQSHEHYDIESRRFVYSCQIDRSKKKPQWIAWKYKGDVVVFTIVCIFFIILAWVVSKSSSMTATSAVVLVCVCVCVRVLVWAHR